MRLHELRTAVAVLLGMPAIGVVGFRLVEGWAWLDCVWMAVITITTIGFGEVHPLSDAGRIFTLVYIVGSVGAAGYAVAAIAAYAIEGGLAHDLAERRRIARMRMTRDHFVIVGFGRLGREIAEELHHYGGRIVVIDVSAEGFRALPPDALHIAGDGASDAVLREAGVERARGVAVATPSTAVNVYITLAARQMNPDATIITRVEDRDAEARALRAGASAIVSPFASAGSRMAQRLLHPNAAEFVEGMVSRANADIMMADIALGEGTPIVGALGPLALRERYGIGVIAIRRADGRLVSLPAPEERVGVGDIAVVVGSPDALAAFRAVAAPG